MQTTRRLIKMLHLSLQGDWRWTIPNAGTSVWQLYCPPWDLQKRSGDQIMPCFCMWPDHPTTDCGGQNDTSDWGGENFTFWIRLGRWKRERRSLTSRLQSFAPVRRGGSYIFLLTRLFYENCQQGDFMEKPIFYKLYLSWMTMPFLSTAW